jgi:carbonic anhydrase/acetyltransferase-like protein (isoleucine patch superfamily)
MDEHQIWALDGVSPRIHDQAWIAPNAVVIGNVEIGAQSGIWFNCVLRGDTNLIRIGERSNVQDGTIIHVNPGETMQCLIGDDVTIGHGAIIHACRLQDRAFVGIGAIVLDEAVVESGGVLAAGAVLTPGKRLPAGELWAGAPARKLRDLSEDDRFRFSLNAPAYVRNASRFRAGLRHATF